MARLTSALLRLTTTDLWKIALALKAAPKQKSNYRLVQRFLAEYEVDFTALGRLLVHLLPQSPPHLVVIDRREWHVGQTPVDVLTIGGGTMEGRFRLFGASCRAEAGLGRPTTPICWSSFSM
jgi:hypothetical protein